jgi:hypothetical protein
MIAYPNGPPEGGQEHGVWIGAKTREPLQFLRPLDERWHKVRI